MSDQSLVGSGVVDPAGDRVGVVVALLVDPVTRQGKWLLIESDAADGSRVAPLAAASVDASGRILLPWSAATIAAAPAVGRTVDQDEDDALAAYYASAPA